jgi:hypothetical protein
MGDTLFKGKSVALIGPAPHIIERRQYFRDYDLVCRINNAVHMPDDLALATGTRCDVWYASDKMMTHKSHFGKYDYVKYLRAGKSRKRHLDPQVKHKFSEMHGFLFPVRKLLKCEPNRGVKAIIDILMDNPKRLYITGFTFYQVGKAYFDGYCSEKGQKQNTARKGECGNHSQPSQLDLFVTLIWQHPKVKVDAELNEVCENWKIQDPEMINKEEWKWLQEKLVL